MSSKQAMRFTWAASAIIVAVSVVLGVTHAFGRNPSVAQEHWPSKSVSTPVPSPVVLSPESRGLLEQFSDAFESVAAAVNPSVVPIFSEHKVKAVEWFSGPESQAIPEPFRDLFPHFFDMPGGNAPERTMRSLGSGVIVSPDGYILTNNHVVDDADKLTVAIDKKRYEATVVGTDAETDVAVIKIDAHDLPAATLGDSENIRVGQWVIAVGNPLEMLHSVTAGIVSATGRSSVGLANYEDFIQTDASINPGNSGGALADLDGKVIGINTAIASPTGGNVGVGFAIPINLARQVMNDLIQNGRISRGYMGLLLQDMTDELATALDLPGPEGVLVGDVVAGGPGDRAGIERGDVIVSFEGQKIEDGAQLRNLVAAEEPSTRVHVTVLRNGKERSFAVVLGERPGSETAVNTGTEGGSPHGKLGLSVTDLTPELIGRFGLNQDEHGVLVTAVVAGSPAEEAGLRQGDVIEQIGNSEITSVSQLQDVLDGLPSGKTIAVLVRRGENTFFAPVELP